MLPLSQREFSQEKITNPEACCSFSEFRNRILRRVLAENPLQLLISTLCAPSGPLLPHRLARRRIRPFVSLSLKLGRGRPACLPGPLSSAFLLVSSVLGLLPLR